MRPYDRLRVAQSFRGERRTTLRASWSGFLGVPDPTQTGATVYVTREPDGGDPVVIALPADGWRRGRTHRFEGTGVPPLQASLRPRARGGRFRITRGGGDALLPTGTTRLAILVVMADVRWCAEVRAEDLRETSKRLVGSTTTPLAACPCEPLPGDTSEAIERRVFARHTCRAFGCHGLSPGQAGLLLAPGVAYDELISVTSVSDPTRLRVAPGDADESVLWRKLAVRTLGLTGVPGGGMPIGDPVVGEDELEAVRQWILAGAPRVGTVPAAQALLDCGLP